MFPAVCYTLLRSKLSTDSLVEVLRKVADIAAVEPRHRDAAVLRQVDVRPVGERLALRRADSSETVQRQQQVSHRHMSHSGQNMDLKRWQRSGRGALESQTTVWTRESLLHEAHLHM